MRKIEKLTLSKANIDQIDILKKKQMKDIFGGRSGIWCCTVDAGGTCGARGECESCAECWSFADTMCPYPDYGIKIYC